MQGLEAALGAVSLFAKLRPDEVGCLARHAECSNYAIGSVLHLPAEVDAARLVVVIEGEFDFCLEGPLGALRGGLRQGDRIGDARLFSSIPRALTLTARTESTLAAFSREAFERILAAYPVVALPLSKEFSSELRGRNEQLRRLLELTATTARGKERTAALEQYRRAQLTRSLPVRRLRWGGLFRILVIDRGKEPPFWILTGFLLALAGARLVVFVILKYGLEKHLFALVAGTGPNPMHIHHFNYGLLIVGATGLLSFSTLGRKAWRLLALLLGMGLALVFDEFALFWNLNPDYQQSSSLISSAIVATLLLQLVYFRRLWAVVFGRVRREIRGE